MVLYLIKFYYCQWILQVTASIAEESMMRFPRFSSRTPNHLYRQFLRFNRINNKIHKSIHLVFNLIKHQRPLSYCCEELTKEVGQQRELGLPLFCALIQFPSAQISDMDFSTAVSESTTDTITGRLNVVPIQQIQGFLTIETVGLLFGKKHSVDE